MVKQYLREENSPRLCYSCQKNYINDRIETICQKCAIENENIKQKIIDTMAKYEALVANQQIISIAKIHQEVNQLYEIIDQRAAGFLEQIDKYQQELENLLTTQEEANEMNA